MDGRQFTRLVKQEAIDGPVKSILKTLTSPRVPRILAVSADPIQSRIDLFLESAAQAQKQRAELFRSLNYDQQAMLGDILRECAELSALSFCTLLDGVGGNYEGVFRVHAVDSQGKNTLLNPDNSEMLHDLLSEVCAEEREG